MTPPELLGRGVASQAASGTVTGTGIGREVGRSAVSPATAAGMLVLDSNTSPSRPLTLMEVRLSRVKHRMPAAGANSRQLLRPSAPSAWNTSCPAGPTSDHPSPLGRSVSRTPA
jgi:hypothetical protein